MLPVLRLTGQGGASPGIVEEPSRCQLSETAVAPVIPSDTVDPAPRGGTTHPDAPDARARCMRVRVNGHALSARRHVARSSFRVAKIPARISWRCRLSYGKNETRIKRQLFARATFIFSFYKNLYFLYFI